VRHPFFDDLDEEIANAIDDAIKQMGASNLLEIDLPATPTAVQGPEVYALHAKSFTATPDLYLPWIRARLKQAAAVDLVSYIEARQHLDRLRRSIDDVFEKVDFLITPTTPVPPITIREALDMSPDPAGELWLRNTRPFNAYGMPTISIPCGFTRAGLPIGLQISSAHFSEAKLLSFAFACEETFTHK